MGDILLAVLRAKVQGKKYIKMKSTAIFTYLFLMSVCATTLHGLPNRFARQADDVEVNDIALEEESGNIQDVENNIEEKNVEIMEEKVTDVKMKTEEKESMEEENDDNVNKVVAAVVTTTTTTTITPTTTTTRQSTNDIVNKVAAAVVTTTTTTTTTTTSTTTTRRTTRRPTTQPPSQSVTEDQGIIARIGNVINSGVDNIGNNLVAGGALIAAAASPLWAGLLVGKKRKRRSETSAP